MTINNPEKYGFTHQKINDTMKNVKWLYYCLCDEIATTDTPHTHLYFVTENAMYFSRVKKLFPTADIEGAKGSSQDCRDYIRKEGKYADSEKKETNLFETFEEYGELPLDKSTKNMSISEQVLEMIENGCSTVEIVRAFPSYTTKIHHIEKTRQVLLEEKYKNVFRDVDVTYISGETALGKSRYVMEKYGYSNVLKITNYKHPFDFYSGQDVILFDEFHSNLLLTDMLQWIDGYPCILPARNADKVACFTKVFIVSNIDLDKQYPNVQVEDVKSWNAFIRRINNVYRFIKNDGSLPFSSSSNGTEIISIPPSNYFK